MGLLVTAPLPHPHRGFWVPSGSQRPSLTGSPHLNHPLCLPGRICQRRRGRPTSGVGGGSGGTR